MITANIFAKKDYVAQDGTIPIYLRLTIDRQIYPPIKLNKRTRLNQWDDRTNRALSSHPNFEKLNQLLNQIQRKADETILDHQISGRTLTYETFLREFSGLSPYDFYYLYEKFYQFKKAEGASWAYLDKIKRTVDKLRIKHPTLNLHTIDYQFIINYVEWLKVERKNCQNTINNNIKIFRRIFRHGIKLKLAKENPFLEYRLIQIKTEQPVLTIEEVRKFKNLLTMDFVEEPGKEILRPVLCWFLLAIYTGRRFDDLKNFKHWIFSKEEIKLQQMKRTAGREQNKIITLYMNTRIQDMVSEILSKDYKLCSNQKANKTLKRLNSLAGIFSKEISFHSARHTFATINKGLTDDLTVRRDLLGHDSIKSTLIYDHQDQIKLNQVMRKWDRL